MRGYWDFLPDEEGDKTSHCAFALPPARVADFFAEPSFLIARGECSLLPAVRSLQDHVGGERFAITMGPSSSHCVSGFDRAYDERLVEFIEDVLVPAKPVQESPPRPS